MSDELAEPHPGWASRDLHSVAVGDERETEPADSAWANVMPVTAPLPRPPIEVFCDEDMVRRAARRALITSILGPLGLWAVMFALVASFCTLLAYDRPPWWAFLATSLGFYLLQVAATSARLNRSLRQLLPLERTVRSAYAAPDVLVVESGNGRTEFRAGSLDWARRRGTVTQIRMRRGRRKGFMLSALLTDDDLDFLLSPVAAVHGATQPTPASDLPLIVVVDARLRRAIQAAALRWLWWRPSVAVLVAISLLLIGFGAVEGIAYAGASAFVLGMLGLGAVATLRSIRRAYRPGLVIQASVTDTELRLRSGEDLEDALPLKSARRCHVSAHVVRIDRQPGQPPLLLPRALFPPADLARLQRAIGP